MRSPDHPLQLIVMQSFRTCTACIRELRWWEGCKALYLFRTKNLFVDAQRPVIETDEVHYLDSVGVGVCLYGVYGDVCRTVRGESIDARTDGGKCDRADVVLACQFQRTTVAPGQQLVLVAFAAVPHRSDRVKYPFGRKPKTGCGLGVARLAAVQL